MKLKISKVFFLKITVIVIVSMVLTSCSLLQNTDVKNDVSAFDTERNIPSGLGKYFVTFISTKVKSINSEETILNIFDLENNKSFLTEPIEKGNLEANKNYRYGEVFLAEDINLMILDVQDGNYQVIVNDGKVIRKIGQIKASANIGVYKNKLICTAYNFNNETAQAFIRSYDISGNECALEKEISINGNPSDLKIDDNGNVYVVSYDFKQSKTYLYHFSLDDYLYSEEAFLDYPASCKISFMQGAVIIGCYEKVSDDTKVSKQPINKVYIKKDGKPLSELYNFKEFNVYDIMAVNNILYIVDSPNRPQYLLFDIDKKKVLKKDSIGFDNYYGMKSINNKVYFFSEKEIRLFEKNINKIIYQDNSMSGTISLKIR